MAKDLTPKPDAEVIDALNVVYRCALTAQEAFHEQEHVWEGKTGYRYLVAFYDHLHKCVAHWIVHKVQDRIKRLGGDVDGVQDKVKTTDGIRDAFEHTHDCLEWIEDDAKKAVKVCFEAGDFESKMILIKIVGRLDKAQHAVEKEVYAIDDQKDPGYMIAIQNKKFSPMFGKKKKK